MIKRCRQDKILRLFFLQIYTDLQIEKSTCNFFFLNQNLIEL